VRTSSPCARACRRRRAADGVSARCARSSRGRRSFDQGGNYEIAGGRHVARFTRQADTGRRDAGRADDPRRRHLRELAANLGANPRSRRRCSPCPRRSSRAVSSSRRQASKAVLSGHLFLCAGSPDLALLRRAHRLMRQAASTRRGSGALRFPLKDPYSALIPGVDRRKGNGEQPGTAADRVACSSTVCASACRCSPTHGDLRTRGRFDGNLRKRDLETDTAYKHVQRAVDCRPRRRPARAASLEAVVNPPPDDLSLFRRARRTAPANFRRTSPITIAPWQDSSSATLSCAPRC